MATVWLVRRSTAASFTPASIPLAVRSPYMSVWYNNTNGSLPLSESLPIFWGPLHSEAMSRFASYE